MHQPNVHFADVLVDTSALFSPSMNFSPGPNFNSNLANQLSVSKLTPMMATPSYNLRSTPARGVTSTTKGSTYQNLTKVFTMTPSADHKGMTPLVAGAGASRTPMDSALKSVLLNTHTPLDRAARGSQIDMTGGVFSPALSDISVSGLFEDSEKENMNSDAAAALSSTPVTSNATGSASTTKATPGSSKTLTTIKEDLSQSQNSAASILSSLSPNTTATMQASQVSNASSAFHQTGNTVTFGLASSSTNNVLLNSMPPPAGGTQDKPKTPFLGASADLTPDTGRGAGGSRRRSTRRDSVKLSVTDLMSPTESVDSRGSEKKRKKGEKVMIGESPGEMSVSDFDRSLPAKKRKFAPVVSGAGGGKSEVN